jgi:AmmeMemoRadiSam system protein A
MLDNIILRIAKSAILSKLNGSDVVHKKLLLEKYPFLNDLGAVFVTLNSNHLLRGCIGSIVAYRTLLDDIIHNAISAAFHDPRFTPLHSRELDDLTLEVSVLSEPVILEYKDYDDLLKKVKPNIDGLILKHGPYQGTFLPQVWEQLPHAKDFLEHLSQKAGANPSIYTQHPTIYRYGVEHIKDNFKDIKGV